MRDPIRLRTELVGLYTSDSLRRVFTETLLPWVLLWLGNRTQQKSNADLKKSDEMKPHAASVERLRDTYEGFDDYLEMVIQFGYVTLFASAFPLASALSILCNAVEVYS